MAFAIFDRSNLAFAPAEDADSRYAVSVLGPWLEKGTRHFIANADIEACLLQADEQLFPLMIGPPFRQIRNSYVASLLSHYIHYAIEEFDIELRSQPWLKALGAPLLRGLGVLFQKCRFDQAVFVNNWLLSTNLYPDQTMEQLKGIKTYLLKQFPEHALIFRSVNDRLNQPLLGDLTSLNFARVLSRQVYILDPALGTYRKKDSYRKDLRLQRRTPYRWEEASAIRPWDIPRLKHLYDDLYLKKYSRLNPQFTEAFFAEALARGWLTFWILKKDDVIDAVIGYIERNGVMTAPVVGYDRSLPEETGLFRLLSLKLLEEAIAKKLILHQSSGVSKFKQHRGGEPSLEYNLVYYQHLPPLQRLPWQILQELSRDFMVPLMRNYGF